MPAQVNYYNQFGILYEQSILDCPEPEYWTTDYHEKGRVYREMKERIDQQAKLITHHFRKEYSILDLGCGFGRQDILLAKNGYTVRGIDTSEVFIRIAKRLFNKYGFLPAFSCVDILSEEIPGNNMQVLLLDVLEHIPPDKRNKWANKVGSLVRKGGLLIISLPHLKKRLSSRVNNNFRKAITQHISWFLNNEEHPYPIPNRRQVLNLFKNEFSHEKFFETSETDYYLFQRN